MPHILDEHGNHVYFVAVALTPRDVSALIMLQYITRVRHIQVLDFFLKLTDHTLKRKSNQPNQPAPLYIYV